jgi:hypothetical protein
MQETKNVVQEALIQMKNVEEAIAENAKGILASTMKEEINQLVKESLSEQDEEEDGVELDVDVEDSDSDDTTDTDNEDDMDMDIDMDMDMDSEESPIDLTDASDEEILKVFKAMGEDDGIIVKKDGDDIHLTDNNSDSEYLVKLGESEDDQINMDEMYMDEEMDDESVDDVINAIFSKDGDTSEIDVDDVESDDNEVVYEIHLDEEGDDFEGMDEQEEMDEQDSDEFEGMDEQDSDEFEGMDEQEEMDEQDSDEFEGMDEQNWEEGLDEAYNPKKAKKTVKPKGVGIGSGPKFSYKSTGKGGFKEDKKEGPKAMGTGKAKFEYKEGKNAEGKGKKVETKKVETKEAARTYGMGSKEGRGLRKGITNNRNYVYGKGGVKVESLESEVSMLREKNEEYRKALNVFREKLNEVAIFNSNLAYATRLFTEHSTTKKEKINILRRFDGVETLKESKNLYRSIKDELGKVETKPMNESIETKLNKTVSTGSSTTLIESKTYENPQFLRMKDLMSKIG